MKHSAFPEVETRVLEETGDYLITAHLHTQPSEKIVVTFDNITTGKRHSGFGTDFALKYGYDTVYISQRERTQYQGLSVADVERVLAPVVNGRACISYGSSLGAYCAIYFGGVINAQIIAAAPINHAHPVINARPFRDLEYKHREICEVPRSSLPPIVLFDPFREPDKRFIDACVRPAYPEGNYVELPFAGHTVLETMRQSGVLKNFILSIFDGRSVPEVVLRTEGSHIWHAEIAGHLARTGRRADAREHYVKSLDLNKSRIAADGLLNLLIDEGDIAAVLSALGRVLDGLPPRKRASLLKQRTVERLQSMGLDWRLITETA